MHNHKSEITKERKLWLLFSPISLSAFKIADLMRLDLLVGL